MLRRLLALLLLAALPLAGPDAAVHAQATRTQTDPARTTEASQQAPLPIRAALADRDGDTVPDRDGRRLTVAGRASVASGVLHREGLDVFLTGPGGGVRLRSEAAPTPVAAGDSVVATGVLRQFDGMVTLLDATYRVAEHAERPPEPKRLDVHAGLEAVEGHLVEVRAQVAGRGRTVEGDFLNLIADDSLLVAFVYADHGGDATFNGLEVGQHVVMTGLLGQFDRVPPHNTSYQIYPRGADDIRVTGLPPSFYPRMVVAGLGLLALALLWIWALRRQVQRRVRELQATEVRYQALFQHAGDALFLHALAPGGARLLEVNDVACRLLGMPREEIVRRPLASVIVGGAAPLEAFLGVIETQREALREFTLRTADGREVPVEVRAHRFVFEGRPVVLSIARDATERKAYENGLIRARREAEALAEAKSAFLANMSHEIRTPLAAITGFAEILREELDGTYGDFAGLIDESARRLLGTLNSILDLARMGAGEVRAHATPFDAVASVRSSVALLQPLAQRKNLHLGLETAEDELPVDQDPVFLDRIVNNLVGNAIKFTAEGHVTVSLRGDGEGFVLTVRDTGAGIDPAFMPHLFEEFKQESQGHGKRHEGTGLGLAITQRLVRLMGGTIDVESVQGEGSVFTVRLPRVLPDDTSPEGDGGALQPAAAPTAGRRGRPLDPTGTAEAAACPVP